MKKYVYSNLALFLIPLLVLFILIAGLGAKFNKPSPKLDVNRFPVVTNQESSSEVLSHTSQRQDIYLYTDTEGNSNGGVFSLASTAEPAIYLGGNNLDSGGDLELYEANEDALLDYITHDKDGNQMKKTPDSSKLRYMTKVKRGDSKTDESSKILLPLPEVGIFYLKIKIGKVQAHTFIVRSNLGTIVKEGDNEFIFWAQDYKTKRSITDAMALIYNLQDSRKELERVPFNSEGIAKARLAQDTDIALIAKGNDRALIPVNLKYLNSPSYESFRPKSKVLRYFIFTDRPLYKPGDTVYFKAVIRDDDDARYTVPTGNVLVRITDGYDSKEPLLDRQFGISAEGTINGEYKIPLDGKIGYYTLTLTTPDHSNEYSSDYNPNYTSFDVQHFRKPEFTLDVATTKTEITASDTFSFTIKGSYFSGQPLSDQKVKYKVYSSDFYEYDYLSDFQNVQNLSSQYRYGGWFYGSEQAANGAVNLDRKGEAEIEVKAKIPGNRGKTQVFSIEATLADGTQNPSIARKNILVYAGEYGIYRKDYSYGSKVNTQVSIPLILAPHKGTVNVSNITLTSDVRRDDWITYQEKDLKYPSYKKVEENLEPIKTTTDGSGNATLVFTPKKTGSYHFTVSGKDSKGNKISKVFYTYISDKDYPYYSEYGGNSDLSLSLDKKKYNPTDTVHVDIHSNDADKDVLITVERGRVDRFQVVKLTGKNGTFDIPLIASDLPNTFISASTFSSHSFEATNIKVPISTDTKKLVVKATPNSKSYGPGETVTVNVQTSDVSGNPVSSDVALWTVDKAIFELHEASTPDIFNTFWIERYNTTVQAHSLEGILVFQGGGGGCFVKGTQVLMDGGKTKNIEDIKSGEFILTWDQKAKKLVKAKITSTHSAKEAGYLIINTHLKVTANHKMWVNNEWKEAGSIQIRDTLLDKSGKYLAVSSIEWQRENVDVYNLEVEKYHTYFANGILVHNQKGGVSRTVLKDTAYWNPSIRTDETGRATVSFKLPDNLTTWTLAAVGATSDTRVGQATEEIVVSKDIIVRPVIPNVLRVGDQVKLKSLVQNFTNKDQLLDVFLQFDSGVVEKATKSGVLIKSSESKEVEWNVNVTKESENGKIVFGAYSPQNKKLGDILSLDIPVLAFGFEEQFASTGDGSKDFTINLSPDSHKQKSKAALSLSSTMVGSLPTAMEYLIGYPYGCVEQTASRFVPAVIAKSNPDLFKDALVGKNIDDILKKGVDKLKSLQNQDGGWSWWNTGESDYFITAYVVEYLLEAQKVGTTIDQIILLNATQFLSNTDRTEKNLFEGYPRRYALTLLDPQNKLGYPNDNYITSPDYLALAVMTNVKRGDLDPKSNGLQQLISLAKAQGDGLYWEAGDQKMSFASKEASTALAIRAILEAKGDREVAVKAARYLMRNRKTNYWANTFATSQVIRALTELSKTGSELAPHYSYTVLLDGKQIGEGSVTSAFEPIKDIQIPLSAVRPNGSKISVQKTGNGQLYSTLVVKDFRTSRDAKAESNGMSVTREYKNLKGDTYKTIKIGDTVIVNVTISGLSTDDTYGVIGDELPSGLIPINESFKNETTSDTYYDPYSYRTDKEITRNGAILSLYTVTAGTQSYTYKARAVSEGVFSAPPALASLMYSPEINGRSDAQTITIGDKAEISKTAGQEFISQFKDLNREIIGGVIVGILILVILFLLRNKIPFVRKIVNKIQSVFRKNDPPEIPQS